MVAETACLHVPRVGVPLEAVATKERTLGEERQELHRQLEAVVWQARAEQLETVDADH